MARIYVSSTFEDLAEYRKEVNLALRRLGHEDIAMEYYVAEHDRPLDKCLADVMSSDVYVGIFAWHYGYVPLENNPEARSITELEYRTAFKAGKPCLVFLLSEDAPWPKSKVDKAPASDQLDLLREDLQKSHIIDFFESADELTRKVNEAVVKWEKRSGTVAVRPPVDWDAYRQAVFSRHQWVRLQVIAGASKERGVLKIPLTEVFEAQLVAAGASQTDVPEEVRKYQEEIYGPRQHAPEGAGAAGTEVPEAKDESPEAEAQVETEETFLSANTEPVLDALGREATQVVLGGPGSGKSTVLQYVMLRVCQTGPDSAELPVHLQGAPIPFLIELRDFVLQQSPDFVSYIVHHSTAVYDAPVDADSLVSILMQPGQSLIFFDGLDEVFDPVVRRRVIDQFQTFGHRYPHARIIVTSRIAGYDRTALGLAGFEHYTLLPLSLGQIRRFAGQWYQYYSLEGTERTASGLVQRIVESPRLLDLAGNPLLLTMMAVIYKDRDLPNERWRLYMRCADTLLEDWELGKGIEDEDLPMRVRTAQKAEILQRVSLYMLEHGHAGRELNAIAYAPLLNIVACYLEEKYQRSRGDAEAAAVDILRHLMERTYVLAGIGERVFGFVHRTFMEYFAACQCQAEFNARKSDFTWLTNDIFGAHWAGGDWEEVLLLLTAMLHDQGTPIREIVEHLRNDKRGALPFNVAFAARCLGEAGDLQDPAQGASLLADLSQSIATSAPQSRKPEALTYTETALKAFATLAPLAVAPAAVNKAIDSLNHAGSVAARMAAWQMGWALRSRKERMGYALAALNDPEEVVRRGAIASLEREWPGRADVGPALADVVRHDRQSRVRQGALAAMQRSWRYEPAILDAIASRVDDETAYTYVIRLIDYLAVTWRGNPTARDLVIKLVGPKPKARYDYDYASVVRSAGQALMQGWRGEAHAILVDWATNHPAVEARPAAIQAIGQGWRDDPQTLPWLLERSRDDQAPDVRQAAITAIGQGWRDDPQTLPWLLERAIADEVPGDRDTAIDAIARPERSDPQTLHWLRQLATDDQTTEVRRAAIAAIAQNPQDDPQTLSWLRQLATDDPAPEARRAAIAAIAQNPRDDPQTLPWLRQLATDDPAPEVRQTAITAIGQRWLDDPQTLPWLRELALDHHTSEVRQTAIEAIGWVWWGNDRETFSWLLDIATNDQSTEVRKVAIAAIGRSWRDDPQTLPWLRQLATTDQDSEIRRAAVVALMSSRWWGWGLAFQDDQDNLPWLCQLAVNDVAPEVREAAIEVIGQTWRDDAETFPCLRQIAVDDQAPVIRQAAIAVIVAIGRDDPQTLPWLRQLATDDPRPENRHAAITAIATTWRGDPQTLPWLRQLATDDPRPENRQTAITAIATRWRGDPQTLPWLNHLATGDQPSEDHGATLDGILTVARSVWVFREEALAVVRDLAAHASDAALRDLSMSAIASLDPITPSSHH